MLSLERFGCYPCPEFFRFSIFLWISAENICTLGNDPWRKKRGMFRLTMGVRDVVVLLFDLHHLTCSLSLGAGFACLSGSHSRPGFFDSWRWFLSLFFVYACCMLFVWSVCLFYSLFVFFLLFFCLFWSLDRLINNFVLWFLRFSSCSILFWSGIRVRGDEELGGRSDSASTKQPCSGLPEVSRNGEGQRGREELPRQTGGVMVMI